MSGWTIALLIIFGIYVAGAVGFYLWLPASPTRAVLALAWPFTLLWMLIGNVQ